VKVVFYLLNATFAMKMLDLFSHVRIASFVIRHIAWIFQILQFLFMYPKLHWRCLLRD